MTLEAWRTAELRDLLGETADDIELSRGLRHVHALDALGAAWMPGEQGRQASYVERRARRLGGRVLVTQIDNYDFFGWLSTALPGTRVVAIQNGVRLAHELATLRSTISGGDARLHGLLHDVFLCWGRSDADRLARAGLTARHILPIGSLRDALHRRDGSRAAPTAELAVALIKPKTFARTNDAYRRNQSSSRLALLGHLARYCRATRLTPSMVLVPGSADSLEAQRVLVDRYYAGPWISSVTADRGSSYDAVMTASVALGDQSSLLVEALGRGRRILSVNMTDDPSLDFPVPGPWSLKKPTYEEFAERMTWIRTMSDAEWSSVVGDVPKYLVNYNPEYPTHVFIKDLVTAIAEDRPWPEVTW